MHHIGRGGEKSAIERDGGGGGIAEKRRRRRNSRGFVAGRKGEGANPSSLSGSLPALALLRPQPQSGQSRTTHPASLVCSLLRPPDFCAYMCGIFCTEVRGPGRLCCSLRCEPFFYRETRESHKGYGYIEKRRMKGTKPVQVQTDGPVCRSVGNSHGDSFLQYLGFAYTAFLLDKRMKASSFFSPNDRKRHSPKRSFFNCPYSPPLGISSLSLKRDSSTRG